MSTKFYLFFTILPKGAKKPARFENARAPFYLIIIYAKLLNQLV